MVNLILIGVVALYLLICVGFGFVRGLAKSRIRLISVAASAVQITGYGTGFLKAFWYKMVLKQPLETKDKLTKIYNRG